MGLGPGPDLLIQRRHRAGVGKERLPIGRADLAPSHVDLVTVRVPGLGPTGPVDEDP